MLDQSNEACEMSICESTTKIENKICEHLLE
jgi:hypothetical protein